MTAQMSLVSLGVKEVVASVPRVEGLVLSPMVALIGLLFWLLCGRFGFGVVEQCCRYAKRKL